MSRERLVIPAVLLLVGLFVGIFFWRPVLAQEKKGGRTIAKLEYKVISPARRDGGKLVGLIDSKKLEEQLNGLGDEGWECVGTMSEPVGVAQSTTFLIFKRYKQP